MTRGFCAWWNAGAPSTPISTIPWRGPRRPSVGRCTGCTATTGAPSITLTWRPRCAICTMSFAARRSGRSCRRSRTTPFSASRAGAIRRKPCAWRAAIWVVTSPRGRWIRASECAGCRRHRGGCAGYDSAPQSGALKSLSAGPAPLFSGPGECIRSGDVDDQLGGDALAVLRRFLERRDLVEVHVAVDFRRHGIDGFGVFQVFLHRRQATENAPHRGEFRRGEVDIGAVPETVGEVAGGGGQHGGFGRDPRLVAHAQGAAGHFGAGAGLAVDAVVAFFHQGVLVHAGGRADPEAGGEGRGLGQQLAGGAEVADV